MARKGRIDRGLVQRKDVAGKPIWYVRVGYCGKEKWFGSFRTKTEARKFYEKQKADQTGGRFFPERFQKGKYELVGDALARYMDFNTNKSRWVDRLYARWWKVQLDGKRLNEITPAVLEQAMENLRVRQGRAGKPYAPQTLHHYMKFMRHVLNVAVRDGKLERNPFAQVRLPRVSTGRTRFLSLEEESRLMEALGPKFGPWARLAILTGMRREEQFSLRWADIDLGRGLITLPRTKAGEVQFVHLNEEAKSIMRSLIPGNKSIWMFPSQNPDSYIDPRHFYARIYRKALKQAGLEGVTWHDLRHTFASRLAMSGQTESTIAALLRHQSTALVKRYAHLAPAHLQDAVERVARFGRGGGERDSVSKVGTNSDSESNRDESGMLENGGSVSRPEVLEKTGAPDRIRTCGP